jgi:hypothetical protein
MAINVAITDTVVTGAITTVYPITVTSVTVVTGTILTPTHRAYAPVSGQQAAGAVQPSMGAVLL